MTIKAIEEVTGAVLTVEDVQNMRLPFHYGWGTWGVYDDRDELIETFDSYRKAVLFEKCGYQSPAALAA